MNELTQKTEGWHEARRGIITGSYMADVLRYSKPYMNFLIARRNGASIPSFTSKATEHGNTYEPVALAAYELMFNVDVQPGRFCLHPAFDYFGGTPDAFVGDDGLIEVKCPEDPGNHLFVLATGDYKAHVPQMAAYLAITDRAWCDFISFDPRQDITRQLFVDRYYRDRRFEDECLDAVHRFWRAVLSGHMPDLLDADIPQLF